MFWQDTTATCLTGFQQISERILTEDNYTREKKKKGNEYNTHVYIIYIMYTSYILKSMDIKRAIFT